MEQPGCQEKTQQLGAWKPRVGDCQGQNGLLEQKRDQ